MGLRGDKVMKIMADDTGGMLFTGLSGKEVEKAFAAMTEQIRAMDVAQYRFQAQGRGEVAVRAKDEKSNKVRQARVR